MSQPSLLSELRKIEREMSALEYQDVLIEMMRNDALARIIIAEERRVIRYAVDSGIIDRRSLNEGLAADITLGLGQAIGGLPGLAQLGVGAAFGAAGVLYYGNAMLNTTGFDSAMNLLFCLLSAAAIDPSGIGAEMGAFGKLLKPFAELGKWARGLGSSVGGAAATAYKTLSGPSRAIVQGAVRAEGPLMRGLAFVSETIMPRIGSIFQAIKGSVTKLPGGGMFGRIVSRVTSGAVSAVKMVTDSIKSLIVFGKNALGVAGRKGVEAAAKMLPTQAATLLSKVPQFAYTTTGGVSRQVALGVSKEGKLLLKFSVSGGKGASGTALISAAELPNVMAQIVKTGGKEAGSAFLKAAQVNPGLYGQAARTAALAAGLRPEDYETAPAEPQFV